MFHIPVGRRHPAQPPLLQFEHGQADKVTTQVRADEEARAVREPGPGKIHRGRVVKRQEQLRAAGTIRPIRPDEKHSLLGVGLGSDRQEVLAVRRPAAGEYVPAFGEHPLDLTGRQVSYEHVLRGLIPIVARERQPPSIRGQLPQHELHRGLVGQRLDVATVHRHPPNLPELVAVGVRREDQRRAVPGPEEIAHRRVLVGGEPSLWAAVGGRHHEVVLARGLV